ncbi:MAG: hypothetical protein IH859_08155 [Chloroflexi bacterium]|nr:hypothetical protein [Chloroflexota bacterium]
MEKKTTLAVDRRRDQDRDKAQARGQRTGQQQAAGDQGDQVFRGRKFVSHIGSSAGN